MANLILIGFLYFLAPNKEPLSPAQHPADLTGKLIDLARLAKGRILVCYIKEGMTPKEVGGILGFGGGMCGGIGHYIWFYDEYGISVDFTPPFGVEPEKYDPRVISVHWFLPPKYRWNGLWISGKSSNHRMQKLNSDGSPSDPNQRMHELINSSKDVREIEEEWEKLWPIPNPKVERVHGGIQ